MKIYGCENANSDFPCAKLQNVKRKFAKKIFLWLWKNPELILINMFRPTYMPNLVNLNWKMSSGMSKEASSLNGPLCTYLMGQNLHDRTRWDLRVINVLAKFENDPWKIMDVRVLAGLVCPAARPPGQRQYPGALKGCGVKSIVNTC